MKEEYDFDYSQARPNRFARIANLPKYESLYDAFMAWRLERVSIERVEAAPILDHDIPFTSDFEEWRELRNQFQNGDELWTFRSPDEFWECMMGWQGLLLIRNGRLVAECISAQN